MKAYEEKVFLLEKTVKAQREDIDALKSALAKLDGE